MKSYQKIHLNFWKLNKTKSEKNMKTLNLSEVKNVTGGYFIIYADNPSAFEQFHGYPMPQYLRDMLN